MNTSYTFFIVAMNCFGNLFHLQDMLWPTILLRLRDTSYGHWHMKETCLLLSNWLVDLLLVLWPKQVINISGPPLSLIVLFQLIPKPVPGKLESTPALLNQGIVILSHLTVITLVMIIFPNVLYILYTSLPLSWNLSWREQENDSKRTLKQICGASVRVENYEGVYYVVTIYCSVNRNLSSWCCASPHANEGCNWWIV